MNTVLLNTSLGPIRGIRRAGYMEFRGIPYAQPPVKERRWRAPEPIKAWSEPLDATQWPPMAMQKDVREMPLYGQEFYNDPAYWQTMSEDCLYLNIWTPEKPGHYPVAVWIHGGAFAHGYSFEKEFDGEAYARRGVILVSIAYRLNVFGFLADPQGDRDNNRGILDQLQALRWVHDNISDYGGDPSNVTLFGQSAGAFSVEQLLYYPEAEGLFHRVILQSGCSITGGFTACQDEKTAQEKTKAFLEKLHCQTVQELEVLPVQTLMTALSEMETDNHGLYFAPIAQTGIRRKLPCIIGAVKGDILTRGAENPLLDASKAFALENGPAQSYVYLFNHDLPGNRDCAFHSCELWYTFGTYKRWWRPTAEADRLLSAQMTDYWTNFMKTGDPNGNNVPYWGCSETEIKHFD